MAETSSLGRRALIRLVIDGSQVLSNILDSLVAVSRVDGVGAGGGSGILGSLAGESGGSLRISVDADNDRLLGDEDAATRAALLEDDGARGGTESKVLDGSNGDTRGKSLGGILEARLNVGNLIGLGNVVTAIGPVGAVSEANDGGAVHEAGADEVVVDVSLPVTHCNCRKLMLDRSINVVGGVRK